MIAPVERRMVVGHRGIVSACRSIRPVLEASGSTPRGSPAAGIVRLDDFAAVGDGPRTTIAWCGSTSRSPAPKRSTNSPRRSTSIEFLVEDLLEGGQRRAADRSCSHYQATSSTSRCTTARSSIAASSSSARSTSCSAPGGSARCGTRSMACPTTSIPIPFPHDEVRRRFVAQQVHDEVNRRGRSCCGRSST